MPLVVYYQDENGNNVLSGTRMMIAALVCSIGAVICYLICYAMTTERVKVEQTTSQFRVSELLSGIVHNRALIGIIVSSICMILAQMTLTNMTTYLFPNFYGNIRGTVLIGTGRNGYYTDLCFLYGAAFGKTGKKGAGNRRRFVWGSSAFCN